MRDSGTVSTGPNLAKSTDGIAGRAAPPGARRPPLLSHERRLDVFACDTALLARPLDKVEIETEFARQPANGWPGENAGEVGNGGARGGHRRPRR